MSPARPLRLLIVEDSEADTRLMLRALESHGFAVDHLRVATERALAEALRAGDWEAALVDHNLPGFSGPAAMRFIQERDPDLPLIVVSGTIGEQTAVDCMKAGAHDYVLKGNLLRLGPAVERELRQGALRRKHRQNEQAIRDSAREWRTTFDGVSSPVAVLDRQNRFLRCNLAMQRFLGLGFGEILGRDCAELIPELPCHDPEHPLRRVWETGGTASLTSRLRDRWFEITAEPVPGDGGDPQRAVLVLRDVTGQMDSLHFLQSLVDALPTPVYFQDQEGVFRLCNQAFLRAFGLSREQVIGRGAAEFLPGGLAEILEHFHRELRQGSGTRALETRLPLADGLPHDLLLAMTSYHGSLGQAQGVLGQAADITEARRAEERFRTLFEGAADALFIHDAQGQVLEVNTEACSRLGYTREELLRLNLREIEGSAGAEALDLRLREVVQRGQALFQTVHLARDGSPIPTEVSARTMELQGRTVIFSTARDISERRKAEDERVRLEAMVQQAQKLEAIGQLAGGVAHDFGNILTAILGYCEILLKRVPPGPNLEFVRQIQAACHRASTLTQGLLAFGRRQPFSPRPLELNGWLAAMQDFFRRLLREDIELAIQSAPAPLPLQADEAQLEQVLLNLLTNARDAMPRGGRILVAAARQGDRACLSVSDQGTGLDEATRSRIFEPFFTTKERGKGTGLGLAVVWGIVQQHHGAIEVDSTPGQGTTFRVLLPLVAGAMEATPTAPGEAPPPAGRETVLLAEDDRMLRGLLSASLREAGYTVLEAADGQEALRLFSSAGLRIDAAILDIVMPQVTGDQVLQEIRARRPGLPALLMSGHVPEGAERLAAANGLLRKPFATAELLRRLREALDA